MPRSGHLLYSLLGSSFYTNKYKDHQLVTRLGQVNNFILIKSKNLITSNLRIVTSVLLRCMNFVLRQIITLSELKGSLCYG